MHKGGTELSGTGGQGGTALPASPKPQNTFLTQPRLAAALGSIEPSIFPAAQLPPQPLVLPVLPKAFQPGGFAVGQHKPQHGGETSQKPKNPEEKTLQPWHKLHKPGGGGEESRENPAWSCAGAWRCAG